MAFEYAVALTGGIATGKSTVKSLMSLYGFRAIDADAIAHQVLNEQSTTIANTFGKEYIDNSGKVKRKELGRYIFANKEAKKELESILHPLIKDEITRQSHYQDSFKKPYFIDIPLFFETKNYPIDYSVVVYAPFEIQLQRVIKRDNLTQQEAVLRIKSQLDIEKKRDLATWVIDNSKDLSHLQNECERIKNIIIKSIK